MADAVTKGYVDKAVTGAIDAALQKAPPWTGPVTLGQIKPSPWLTLSPCGIKIDCETGEVIIPENLALTEAACAFWDAVQHVSGYRKPGFW